MTDDFDAELEKAAISIAKKAVEGDTPFSERLDAFKALTAYYGHRLKRKEPPADEDGEPGIGDMARDIAAASENGNGRVRGR